jgi:hypothetical protein
MSDIKKAKSNNFEALPKEIRKIVGEYITPFEYNIENSNIHLFEFLLDTFYIKPKRIIIQEKLYNAVDENKLWLAKFLKIKFNITEEEANLDDCCIFKQACDNNNLEMTEWLYDTFETKNIEGILGLFKDICKYGFLDIVKFLYSKFDIPLNPNLFFEACIKNYLDIAEWLFSSGIEITIDTLVISFSNSCTNDSLDVVEWLLETFDKKSFDISSNNYRVLRQVCVNNDLNMLKLLHKNFDIHGNIFKISNYRFLMEISKSKAFDVLKWVINNLLIDIYDLINTLAVDDFEDYYNNDVLIIWLFKEYSINVLMFEKKIIDYLDNIRDIED